MRFDDRLRTVLNHPAHTGHERAVRWRQLVDLLSRGGPLEFSKYATEALSIVRSDAPTIDDELRAATARAIAARPLPVELVELFASDELPVSAPILAAANLSTYQWQRILEGTSGETSRFIRSLHPQLAQGAVPREEQQVVPEQVTDPEQPTAQISIEEVISRIEALREARDAGQPPVIFEDPVPTQAPPVTPAVAPATAPALFRWECGPSGELEWVEGAPRAGLIGRTLVEPGLERQSGNAEIARAFALRAPFSNAVVSLAEETTLDGEWELSGVPAFDHSNGRFAGYRGVARRTQSGASPQTRSTPHPDTLRELVHEIKTPLNAIMGFAQIIEGQMFGPAATPYRQRAAEIVAQSHLLLAAIDDLDLAAKLQATEDRVFDSDLESVVDGVVADLQESARSSGVELRAFIEPQLPPCTVSPAIVGRLVSRLVGAMIDCSKAGARLRVSVGHVEDCCTVAVDRPERLDGVGEHDLLDPAFATRGQKDSRMSLGFTLRLVRGIARLAGGDLRLGRSKFTLVLGESDLHGRASRRYRQLAGQGL